MIQDILAVLWIFLPAGLANMAPIFANHWHLLEPLNRPIDNGKTWRGRRLFGDHKTVRGFVVGWLAAVLLVWLQAVASAQWNALAEFNDLFDYEQINLWWWATALSFGALGGDTIKSFFKRQLDIKPGKAWVPFDQIDYVIGTLAASWLVLELPLRVYVIATVLGLILHPVSTVIGWALKLKDQPI